MPVSPSLRRRPLVAPRAAEDLVAHLFLIPHPGAPSHALRAPRASVLEHAPVDDHADPLDRETLLEPLGDRHQRLDVGRVARPHLAAQRPALLVGHDTDDALFAIPTVVLAVAVLSKCLAALPSK